MSRLSQLLPAILSHKSSLIDQALSEALRAAEPDEIGPLADAVLRRDLPDRSVGLILRYHQLPADIRHTIVDRAEELAGAVRKAATRHGEQGTLNAISIIEQAGSTRMAYLITALIRHTDRSPRERAADCLRALAARCRTTGTDHAPHLDAESASYLTQSVEQAVLLYANHDHPAVLEAMTQLAPRPMPEAWEALRQKDHPATAALAALLREADNPAVRRGTLALLGIPALAKSAAEGLRQANHRSCLHEPLAQGHLFALPMVRKGLARAPHAATLWPGAKERNEMSTDAQHHLPALACALPLDPQDRVMRLAGLARARQASTRLSTLRRLLAIATDETGDDLRANDHANDVIATFTSDPDAALARTALWHLIRVQYNGLPRILAGLVNSRHPEVRAVAARRLAPLGFEKFWDAWPKLDPQRRLAAGRALIKIDTDFHRHLGGRLSSRDPATRTQALGIIATLSQGTFFEPALIDLVGSNNPRVVASAVRALGGCDSEAARQVLVLAMDHDDPRIRANAIETLAKTDAAHHLDKLLDIAQQDTHRPRANAIKALMELRAKDALPALSQMLHDPRAEHRVSALWLIDELGLLQLARQVAEISVSDDDERVKQRAGHVVQHLIHDLERQLGDPHGMEAA